MASVVETETIGNLVINRMTKEIYKELKENGQINPYEMYLITGGEVFDSELNDTSENAPQTKIVNEEINALKTSIANNETEINTLKNSVGDGKELVANAITEKGVTTATDATFQVMANNVLSITTLPSTLSSYTLISSSTTASGSAGSYALVASKTFDRPILFVTCRPNSTGTPYYTGVQVFFPLWGYTIYGNSNNYTSLVSFTKTTNYEVPIAPSIKTSDGTSSNGKGYIKFSADAKTVYFYAYSSSYSGTFSFNADLVKVYY